MVDFLGNFDYTGCCKLQGAFDWKHSFPNYTIYVLCILLNEYWRLFSKWIKAFGGDKTPVIRLCC